MATILPAATLLVAGADAVPKSNGAVPCCAEPPAAAAPAPIARPAPPRPVIAPLPVGDAPENGLQVKTILAARAVSARFPEIPTIGGVRADALKWHPHGLAIDVMIPHYATAEGKALGDRVVAYVLENADRFRVNHVIWRQASYGRNRPPRPMSDRGSDTANHYDHVHIATEGGGYPTGRETYVLA